MHLLQQIPCLVVGVLVVGVLMGVLVGVLVGAKGTQGMHCCDSHHAHNHT